MQESKLHKLKNLLILKLTLTENDDEILGILIEITNCINSIIEVTKKEK